MQAQPAGSAQMTMPLFDKTLLDVEEEMADVVVAEITQVERKCVRDIVIKGGMRKGNGIDRRLFVAGRIRMTAREKVS